MLPAAGTPVATCDDDGAPRVLVIAPQRGKPRDPQPARVLDRFGTPEALKVTMIALDMAGLKLVSHGVSAS
jgi:hypothetical protein